MFIALDRRGKRHEANIALVQNFDADWKYAVDRVSPKTCQVPSLRHSLFDSSLAYANSYLSNELAMICLKHSSPGGDCLIFLFDPKRCLLSRASLSMKTHMSPCSIRLDAPSQEILFYLTPGQACFSHSALGLGTTTRQTCHQSHWPVQGD